MGAGAVSLGAVAPDSKVSTLVERLRRVHQRMVDAALTGDGFERMAELAAQEVGHPVAIVLPALEVAVVWPGGHALELDELERFGTARVDGLRASIPNAVELVVPITFGDQLVGGVAMLMGEAKVESEASEFLHLAATAAATAYALEEARTRDAVQSRGCVLEALANGAIDPQGAVRMVRSAGFEFEDGLMVAVTEAAARPHEAVALVESESPRALVELVGARVYALLPAARTGPPGALGTVEGVTARLRAYGPTGTSSRYADPTEIGRALREAELVLEALADDSPAARALEGDAGPGVYRLLFRALASDPGEVRRFYEDTVGPLVGHDEQYRGDLLPTLEAYLEHDFNMNATAKAIYAHRHTVAYRLERVRELTGLDPTATEDRERLGLGLKALRIMQARPG
jgi:hypothetical protein